MTIFQGSIVNLHFTVVISRDTTEQPPCHRIRAYLVRPPAPSPPQMSLQGLLRAEGHIARAAEGRQSLTCYGNENVIKKM